MSVGTVVSEVVEKEYVAVAMVMLVVDPVSFIIDVAVGAVVIAAVRVGVAVVSVIAIMFVVVVLEVVGRAATPI